MVKLPRTCEKCGRHNLHYGRCACQPLPPLYRELEAMVFAASWERMVLLASTLEYRDEHGCALPSPDRDHDLITLEAMIACVMQHTEDRAVEELGGMIDLAFSTRTDR